ncbi:hypothetical protein F0562_005749 [Nyssa sinensis]|uniref:VQ domain-containing protein n=1 Tax=Nyssa sinensis TaxID=561372 RepID=A0A5J5AK71_9ASTE|nr:hypothetical protein F0562_005749 [Nyssa sinensis]
MDPPDYHAGGRPSPTRREIQGPRPSPLKVSKESHKIRKPPVAPQPSHAQEPPPHPPQRQESTAENRQPVIIYAVSPKVIHTTVSDFMSLVQRLTGSSSSNDPSAAISCGGDVSPAARLASIERTSPKERERAGDLMGIVEGVEVGQIPGILSPAPATLPPIAPGFFSPGSDPYAFSMLHDQSPFMNMFLPKDLKFKKSTAERRKHGRRTSERRTIPDPFRRWGFEGSGHSKAFLVGPQGLGHFQKKRDSSNGLDQTFKQGEISNGRSKERNMMVQRKGVDNAGRKAKQLPHGLLNFKPITLSAQTIGDSNRRMGPGRLEDIEPRLGRNVTHGSPSKPSSSSMPTKVIGQRAVSTFVNSPRRPGTGTKRNGGCSGKQTAPEEDSSIWQDSDSRM